MLTLDATTLFYWTLSDPPPKKMDFIVESWAKSVRPKSSASRANSVKTGFSKRPGSTLPGLTSSRSQGASSASILTNAITISTKGSKAQVPEAVKIKQDADAIYSFDGALSDNEEITGVERDAAHASPIKGKKRVNSEVKYYFYYE